MEKVDPRRPGKSRLQVKAKKAARLAGAKVKKDYNLRMDRVYSDKSQPKHSTTAVNFFFYSFEWYNSKIFKCVTNEYHNMMPVYFQQNIILIVRRLAQLIHLRHPRCHDMLYSEMK